MKTPARSFKDLIVWQKAHELVLAVYRLTSAFPTEEQFGLTSVLLYEEVGKLLNAYSRAILNSTS